MRRRISRAQQTKNWCVGFSFPPPAYAGIHPTLHLFGFRANALNSHFSSYLPGFDPGLQNSLAHPNDNVPATRYSKAAGRTPTMLTPGPIELRGVPTALGQVFRARAGVPLHRCPDRSGRPAPLEAQKVLWTSLKVCGVPGSSSEHPFLQGCWVW